MVDELVDSPVVSFVLPAYNEGEAIESGSSLTLYPFKHNLHRTLGEITCPLWR